MKTAKDYSRAKTLYFKPEIKLCPHCKSHIKRTHIAWRKRIISLKRTLHVTSYAYRCSNKECPQPQTVHRSVEAETLSLKYYQFSLDVIAKIGHLRYKGHQTIRQIRRTLRERFKLQISRSEIDLLSQAYLALMQANRRRDTTLLEKLRSNGGVVLAIDGVQPEKGNETLWILRDVQTGETLLARNLSSADADSIASLLREVKALRVPVKGVVSDGQRSIRLAVAGEFPGVPHQLCHFHYLRNISKPISEMDRALKVDLRKRVRGVRTVERRVALRGGEKAKVILQYCEATRIALRDDGVYPLKPGGLTLYRRLRKIQQSIQRSNKLQPDGGLERLLRVLGIIDELGQRYRRVRRLYKLVFEANDVLKREAEAEVVEAGMQAYVDRLRGLRLKGREERGAVLNILRFTASYWEGLFHHYRCEEIPRTNNGLEVYVRSLKVAYRKTTGRVSCQGYIVRYGAYVALLDPSISQEEALLRLRRVDYEVFRLCYAEIRGFRVRLSLKRSLSENLKGFLHSLELDWVKSVA